MRYQGFTLVELAIVMTIIGLLIGGVLKGQELLESSRMTAFRSQLKAFDSGIITFRDIYKAYPGDIVNPANFIQNCTTAPCSTSGDGNGSIGTENGWHATESHNMYLHMAKAGLISGIDSNLTWDASTYFARMPQSKWAGNISGTTYNAAADASYTAGLRGLQWGLVTPTGGGVSATPPLSMAAILKYDTKFDDGIANAGDILLHSACTIVATPQLYNPNSATLCYFYTRGPY